MPWTDHQIPTQRELDIDAALYASGLFFVDAARNECAAAGANATINQRLAAMGVETRPSKHRYCKELWFRGESLGDFSAREVCDRFFSQVAA